MDDDDDDEKATSISTPRYYNSSLILQLCIHKLS